MRSLQKLGAAVGVAFVLILVGATPADAHTITGVAPTNSATAWSSSMGAPRTW
jgi:hypothetical protein